MPGVQTALRLIYPPRCTLCGDQVESDFGLCASCWRDTPLISGLVCDACGAPLPGEDANGVVHCDACLRTARPWTRGRAALLYRDNGRKLVLALKHGDRQDVIKPCAQWMAKAIRPVLPERPCLIAPIPLHWLRLLRRSFNQSALLARGVSDLLGGDLCPDLLIRPKHTQSLGGLSHDNRFSEMDRAINPHPRRRHLIEGRSVLLVDDVMTSGATLAAATLACFAAGADEVYTVTLARVAWEA